MRYGHSSRNTSHSQTRLAKWQSSEGTKRPAWAAMLHFMRSSYAHVRAQGYTRSVGPPLHLHVVAAHGCAIDVRQPREFGLQVRIAVRLDLALVGMLAVPVVYSVHSVHALHDAADGSEAHAVKVPIVAEVDEELARARVRPGGREHQRSPLVAMLHGIVFDGGTPPLGRYAGVARDAKLCYKVGNHAEEAHPGEEVALHELHEAFHSKRSPFGVELYDNIVRKPIAELHVERYIDWRLRQARVGHKGARREHQERKQRAKQRQGGNSHRWRWSSLHDRCWWRRLTGAGWGGRDLALPWKLTPALRHDVPS
mmetsp:Transcript_5430/g.19861  ORF Transcript_5430/g.19861 Transcript_5430/m.19861 type:complete len:311 (-) Transcript_5430:14-946(-)